MFTEYIWEKSFIRTNFHLLISDHILNKANVVPVIGIEQFCSSSNSGAGGIVAVLFKDDPCIDLIQLEQSNQIVLFMYICS